MTNYLGCLLAADQPARIGGHSTCGIFQYLWRSSDDTLYWAVHHSAFVVDVTPLRWNGGRIQRRAVLLGVQRSARYTGRQNHS